MATAYLNEGATSLADANWSDSTGFSATAPDLVIESGTQNITGGLDQSGLTEGVNSLKIRPAFAGRIEGVGGEALQVDCDNGTSPQDPPTIFMQGGSGSFLRYQASGNSNVCDRFVMNSSGQVDITGGTITRMDLINGGVVIGSSAVVTNAFLQGGSSTVEHNATGFTSCIISSGTHTIRRGGTFVVGGDANVTFDSEDVSGTITVDVVSQNATVSIASGGTFTGDLIAGTIDSSRTTRAVTVDSNSTVGQTLNIVRNADTTFSSGLTEIGDQSPVA